MKHLVGVVALLATALAGCASPEAPKPAPPRTVAKVDTYTEREYTLLTYCSALTDTAWGIAVRKQSGMSKDEVTKVYAKHPNQELVTAGIEKVYEDKFTHSWDYTVDLFRECAPTIANVPAARAETAAYCMQRSMIAGIAQENRAAGMTEANSYAGMPLPGDTTRGIVTKIYRGSKNRAEATLEAWDDCMKPVIRR